MVVNPLDVRGLIRLATTRTGDALYDDDLTQEASMRAVEAFRRGPVQHPRGFLMKVVSDTVRDHWKKRRRSAEEVGEFDEKLLSVCPDFEAQIDRRRRIEKVRMALDQLPPDKRRILMLFYEGEMSVPEIARLEECSPSAVKMQLLRGRRQLAKLLVGMEGMKM